MASTRHEDRDQSVGGFPSIPKVPSRSSGFRTKWHILSSNARGFLCFYPSDHAYEDHWPRDSTVALHTPTRSDMPGPTSSRDGTARLNANGMPRRPHYHRVYTAKVAKREGRRAAWDHRTTTKRLPSLPTENRPAAASSSEAVASANAPPLIRKRGARRHGLASPQLCDHAALLHLIGARTRAERTERDDVATGDTVEALIDALLQIGDSQRRGSTASLGTPLGPAIEKATNGRPKGDDGDGEVDDEKKESSAGAAAAAACCWEEGDARRAWEAMKRRVVHIEEYGALQPEGDAGDAGTAMMDHNDAERALREYRAWRRRRWAEEAIQGPGQEMSWRAAKKRRRHAGCWIGENGAFARLQYARRI